MRRKIRRLLYARHVGMQLTPEVVEEFERAFDRFRFVYGVVRDHYVERVFIEPEPAVRGLKASLKHSPVEIVVKDARVVVVDDSIVRGDTGVKFIGMLRAAGAKEVHLRVATPQIIGPCYWGLDTPERDKLIAWTLDGNVDRIADRLGCDSLAFVPLERFREVAKDTLGKEFCFSCFDGKDPTEGTSVQWLE
jgi:amidophosphoribosyltransferase